MNETVMDILYQTDRAGYILQLKQDLANAHAEIREQDELIAKLTHELAKIKGN